MVDYQKRTSHAFAPIALPPSRRLRRIASIIRGVKRRHVADVVLLGRFLAEAKSITGHGRFLSWVQENTQLAPRTAQEALLAHKRIRIDLERLTHCLPSTARVLCKKKVARSPKLLEQALALPTRNGMLGHQEMLEGLGLCPEAARRAKELAAAQRAMSQPAVDKLTGKRKENQAEKIGRQMLALAANPSVSTVHIGFEKEEGEIPQVSLTVLGEKRVSISRRTLAEAVSSAAGEEELRRCTKCEVEKSAVFFAKSTHYCRQCERARVREFTEKKRAAKRAGISLTELQ